MGARPDGRPAVHGLPETIHHAAQQLIAHGDGEYLARGDDFRGRRDALHIAQGRQQGHVPDKADHLGLEAPVFPGIAQQAEFPHLHTGDHGTDDGAHHLLHASPRLQGIDVADGLFQQVADVFEGHLRLPDLAQQGVLDSLELGLQAGVHDPQLAFQDAVPGLHAGIGRHVQKRGAVGSG